jgi:hypothetical protein
MGDDGRFKGDNRASGVQRGSHLVGKEEELASFLLFHSASALMLAETLAVPAVIAAATRQTGGGEI